MGRQKQNLDPLTRSIRSRERHIENAKKRIKTIREEADADVAKIEKDIAESQILLNALKRGALKP